MSENNSEAKITFVTEDNEQVELFVLEQTTLNGVTYLLAAEEDSDEEEAVAYIMKDVSAAGSEQAVYDMVEDEQELELIGKIFEELLDDTTIVRGED